MLNMDFHKRLSPISVCPFPPKNAQSAIETYLWEIVLFCFLFPATTPPAQTCHMSSKLSSEPLVPNLYCTSIAFIQIHMYLMSMCHSTQHHGQAAISWSSRAPQAKRRLHCTCNPSARATLNIVCCIARLPRCIQGATRWYCTSSAGP